MKHVAGWEERLLEVRGKHVYLDLVVKGERVEGRR